MQTHTPAALVLADGTIYRGFAMGATGKTLGEAVFTTAMTGYQETLTDPSFHRQITVLLKFMAKLDALLRSHKRSHSTDRSTVPI